VPPHEFDVDFPHLMLRYKAYQFSQKDVSFAKKQLSEVDRNAKVLGGMMAPVTNAINAEGSAARPLIQTVAGVHKEAKIPRFEGQTLMRQVKEKPFLPNSQGVAFGEKVIIYATCFANYNETRIGLDAGRILSHLGVDVRFEYPGCCGMPKLELGNIPGVADAALRTAAFFDPFINDGYDIVVLVPSCTLMLTSEWPLMHPLDEKVQKLKNATKDISDYIISLHNRFNIQSELKPIEGCTDDASTRVTLHLACHARAQNNGAKAREMLNLIPNLDVQVIERCSGHGGTWGMMVDHFDMAIKVGAPLVRQILNTKSAIVSSECPLAVDHIQQGIEKTQNKDNTLRLIKMHPLEIFARALGLDSL
jgi:glycerol-3-phosphate dehydrogenase subunit C